MSATTDPAPSEPSATPTRDEMRGNAATRSRQRLKVAFGDDWMESRFKSEDQGQCEIVNYVHYVAGIGRTDKRYGELEDYDLDAPLGRTLPWLVGGADRYEDMTYPDLVQQERAAAARMTRLVAGRAAPH